MARSRRSYRRTTSQRVVGVFASVLPAPIQRIAETQFGSSILMLGIPALIVAGILQLEWNGGLPQLRIDRNRAQEIRNAARQEFSRISSPETQQTIDRFERSAVDYWNATQGNSQSNYPYQPYPPTYSPNASYPANGFPPAYPQANGNAYHPVSQSSPLPSSSAAQSATSQSPWQGSTTASPYPNSSSYYQQPLSQPTNYPAYPPSTTYPVNQSQSFNQQQTYYQPPTYTTQPPPPSYYQQPVTQQPSNGRIQRY